MSQLDDFADGLALGDGEPTSVRIPIEGDTSQLRAQLCHAQHQVLDLTEELAHARRLRDLDAQRALLSEEAQRRLLSEDLNHLRQAAAAVRAAQLQLQVRRRQGVTAALSALDRAVGHLDLAGLQR